MARVKLALVVILTLLAVILILQNTAPVETRILFATITMPRAVLLIITWLGGVAVGLLAALSIMKKRKKQNG